MTAEQRAETLDMIERYKLSVIPAQGGGWVVGVGGRTLSREVALAVAVRTAAAILRAEERGAK